MFSTTFCIHLWFQDSVCHVCLVLQLKETFSLKKSEVVVFSCVFCVLSSRHRRAIQKSRGSKVRRAEGTMESEPGAPASTVSSTGTTTTSSTNTSSSSTTVVSSNSTATTAATTTTTSTTSPNGSSNTISNSSNSSSATTGRQAVPQISVYSGISDRQTVQVSSFFQHWTTVNSVNLTLCVWCTDMLRPSAQTK